VTPALVGGPQTVMISTLIDQQTATLGNWGFGGALATGLLTVTVALAFLFNRWLRIGRVLGDAP
jgi:mannopine transport system permease protein